MNNRDWCKNCSHDTDCKCKSCPLHEFWLAEKRERLGMFVSTPKNNFEK
jgi:hypothetical protein